MSVTSPLGFVAAGVHAGIKASGDLDLALVATADAVPVAAAAVFTQNLACAAPVQVSRGHLAATGGRAAAVVLNSGNANAATGEAGLAVARETCALVAAGLGCAPEEVLVCSTGLIGIPMPIDPFRTGVPAVVAGLRPQGGADAATAIMTTDTVAKEATATSGGVTAGGMAKGAAMLAPDMATMLAVVTIDAEVDPAVLQRSLQAAVDVSFNRLTVDGCTSTNDTVIVLANGQAGAAEEAVVGRLLSEVTGSLAAQMCADAEGATKVVRVEVRGAATDQEAAVAARKVAQSQLVKCSWYGRDPYWGRVLSELGSAGVRLDLGALSIAYGGDVVSRGSVEVEHDHVAVTDHMAGRSIILTCDLGVGPGSWWLLTNDLTHAYVDENMGTS
ncbi:MAG: Glutamate N-acetyltransferase @ N-acetylglutamate synthase [uncultured Acidimicrobiales bacterium]|uniref:Arginine biosynthesis bifunctional protein ArgJ n=1 Tax=uncultured Acidimicrobiales bacterium TaxID=310071 RepID=A0A6J4ILD7_9ACTN|nr:MAG: Glutamate N-acetyltransferase @ N-acetylglutamate synthase [uncultured Acidimicrobiales bacterium]